MCFSSLQTDNDCFEAYLAGEMLRLLSLSFRFLSLALKLSFSLLKLAIICWIYPSGLMLSS